MRQQWRSYLLAISLVLGVTLMAPAEEPSAIFTTIDFPNDEQGRPPLFTEANAINLSGEIVGRYTDAAGKNHGYLLSQGSFTRIDFPGSDVVFTGAIGINPQGDIVGRYRTADGKFHGYLLSGGEFTSFDLGAGTFTTANGINSGGEIVGNYTDASGIHGFLLNGGEFSSFDFPDSTLTVAWSISPAGEIAGRYRDKGGNFHVFLLSAGVFTSIDFPFAFWTTTNILAWVGINSLGDIVSTYCDKASSAQPSCDPSFIGGIPVFAPESLGLIHGFLLSNGQFTSIDFPDAPVTVATGINPLGNIVGAYLDQSGKVHGYLRSRRN
jgi:uncharacterized membrane protein